MLTAPTQPAIVTPPASGGLSWRRYYASKPLFAGDIQSAAPYAEMGKGNASATLELVQVRDVVGMLVTSDKVISFVHQFHLCCLDGDGHAGETRGPQGGAWFTSGR